VSDGRGSDGRVSDGLPEATEPVWTLLEVLGPAADYLAATGVENARFDAECLLGHVLGLSRLDIYLQYERPLTAEDRATFRTLLRRRRAREPLQHILGEVEFCGLTFGVKPGVFIPRSETELLAERVLTRLAAEFPSGGGRLGNHPLRALELGVGSGVIAVSLAVKRPDLNIWTSDIAPAALALAAENAKRHGMAARVDLQATDGLPRDNGGLVHLVVSNPPYVRLDEAPLLAPEVADYDPPESLFGGEDGLDFYRRLAAEAPARLVPGGILAMEIGADQGEAVQAIVRAAGFVDVELEQDYSRRDRFVFAHRA